MKQILINFILLPLIYKHFILANKIVCKCINSCKKKAYILTCLSAEVYEVKSAEGRFE